MAFRYHPPGASWASANRRSFLKNGERAIRLELGCEGNSPPIKRLGRKPGFPEGDKLEVGVKNGRWVLTNPPDRPRPAVEPVRHYFDAV
jgi:hypothetical protein